LNWYVFSKDIEAKTDKEAQRASLGDDFRRKEICYHGRFSHPIKIIKTVVEMTLDGFRRVTVSEVPLPTKKRCPCGKDYWPVLDEKPCHSLVEINV
jgi:hypothetical protein